MVAGLALVPHATTTIDLTNDAQSALSGDGDMISIGGGSSHADSLQLGQGPGHKGGMTGGGAGGSIVAKSELSTQPSVVAAGQGRGGGMLGGGLERR